MQHRLIRQAWVLLALCAAGASAQTLSFGLFGDTPYSAWERQHLPQLLADMGQEGLDFAVHVGDIKSGASVCSDAVLQDIRDLFQRSPVPLVYLPGDNEWVDCHRKSNGGFDPLERLEKLRALFFSGDQSLGQRRLTLTRQSDDPAYARYRENVRWQAGGVLFVGLNLSGSDNNFHGGRQSGGPSREFLERSAANRAWLAQAFALAHAQSSAGVMLLMQGNPRFEAASAGKPKAGFEAFLTQVRQAAQQYGGQVVLVHGDTHWHRIDQPLREESSGEVLRNFTRVETFGYPFFGWVRASVDASDPKVFRFIARPWTGPAPAQ